jgi:hypothetical protein
VPSTARAGCLLEDRVLAPAGTASPRSARRARAAAAIPGHAAQSPERDEGQGHAGPAAAPTCAR